MRWLFSLCVIVGMGVFAGPLRAEQVDAEIARQFKVLETDSLNMAALKDVAMYYLHQKDYEKVLRYGLRLQNKAYSLPQDLYYCTYSHIILAQAYIFLGDRGLAYSNLGQGEANARSAGNDTILSIAYNDCGLYAAYMDHDYPHALTYFFEALDKARSSGQERLYESILGNLTKVYYLKNDTAGIVYAVEAYEEGMRRGNADLARTGLETQAWLCYLKGDYPEALSRVDELERFVTQHDLGNRTHVYALRGAVLSAMGRREKALSCFSLAWGYVAESEPDAVSFAYVQHALCLNESGRWREALEMLYRAEVFINTHGLLRAKVKLYDAYARVYERSGRYDQALAYYKLYAVENDSLFCVDRENALNDMRMKYGYEGLLRKLDQERMEKMNKESRIKALTVCLLFVVLFLLALGIFYRRKEKLYTTIVQQNRQYIAREKILERQIDDLNRRLSPQIADKYAGSSLSDEKEADLFRSLETLMRERRVYADNMLTREKLAELLGTNRTYLSQVISDCAGKTFTQYVNGYRMREAVERLSDPSDNVALKALSAELGFNSMTTFYNLFQNAVGMSPAQYRKKSTEMGA